MNSNYNPFLNDKQREEQRQLDERMRHIKNKILVLSGKGGVGKSTVSANMAMALAASGKKTGLLDIDIHGPSIPKILGLENQRASATQDSLIPVNYTSNLKVMSIGFLVSGNDDPVIWRGPLKYGLIKQFLKDVQWGDLDYLIVDSPPGTGDEPLTIAQLLGASAKAVVVTTPQDLSISDVRKSINFCRKLNIDILGVVENMSGFTCPHCGKTVDIFKSGGGETMASNLNVPFLGRIPLDVGIVESGDAGEFFMQKYASSPTAEAFMRVIRPILGIEKGLDDAGVSEELKLHMESPTSGETHTGGEGQYIFVAVPVEAGELCAHFGHCSQFALVKADVTSRSIVSVEHLTPPPHEPGLLPRWLHERGANLIIAGGIGQRAKALFEDNGINVVVGAPRTSPEKLVEQYLEGTLAAGMNLCDH